MEVFDGHEQINDIVPDEVLGQVVLRVGDVLERGKAKFGLDVEVLALLPRLHEPHTVWVFRELFMFRDLLQFALSVI